MLHTAIASHRILYAGEDMTLPGRLKDGLKRLDCLLVRSPVLGARTFIQSDIEYSLFLFDDDPTGASLEAYARTLKHRERTPVIMVKKSEGSDRLLDTIRRRLRTSSVHNVRPYTHVYHSANRDGCLNRPSSRL